MTVAYLLDANVFITAKNRHYGFDFCPGFWDWLEVANENGLVFSVAKVRDELLVAGDELSGWAETRGDRFFLRRDASVGPSMSAATSWARARGYEREAVTKFVRAADYDLVVLAHSASHTVVTHEVASNSIRKIKIPDACRGLKIECIEPFEMLRNERARFVLGVA